jgi:hypothetical protein
LRPPQERAGGVATGTSRKTYFFVAQQLFVQPVSWLQALSLSIAQVLPSPDLQSFAQQAAPSLQQASWFVQQAAALVQQVASLAAVQ